MDQANEQSGAANIVFDFEAMGADVINLGSQLPDVTSTIAINGHDRLTIIGGGMGGHRHFYVAGEAQVGAGNLTLIGVTLTEGGGAGTANDRGGAIFNHGGTLAIIDSTISNSSATASGGVRNRGRLTVTNSDFIANGNAFGCAGGAIDNKADGTAVIDGSRFVDNVADVGGAVINDGGQMTITDSTFTRNTALNWGGGGVLNHIGGTMTITGSVFRENRAVVGAGVTNSETLLLEDVEIVGNEARDGGGGIGNFFDGNLTGRRVLISDNAGEHGSGGILSGAAIRLEDSQILNNRGTGAGGAVFSGGTLIIETSTIAGNRADTGTHANGDTSLGSGAGIFNYDGKVEIRRSLISDNEAEFEGGAIWSSGAGVLHITNSTLSSNRSRLRPGSTIFLAAGTADISATTIVGDGRRTALQVVGGELRLSFSIVTHDDGAACPEEPQLARITGDSNLTDSSTCASNAAFTLTDELGLVPLADNGGPTDTHALLPDSPAVDAGPQILLVSGAVLVEDQRGEPRPNGEACDIGAFEY